MRHRKIFPFSVFWWKVKTTNNSFLGTPFAQSKLWHVFSLFFGFTFIPNFGEISFQMILKLYIKLFPKTSSSSSKRLKAMESEPSKRLCLLSSRCEMFLPRLCFVRNFFSIRITVSREQQKGTETIIKMWFFHLYWIHFRAAKYELPDVSPST